MIQGTLTQILERYISVADDDLRIFTLEISII